MISSHTTYYIVWSKINRWTKSPKFPRTRKNGNIQVNHLPILCPWAHKQIATS